MKKRFLLNLPLGILIGAVLALGLAWIFDKSVMDDAKRNWSYLFSAAATLFGAALALMGVFSSIANQNRLAEEVRQRDLAAWRAALPFALSKMIEVARNGIDAALGGNDAPTWSQSDIEAKLMPDASVVETLRSCIKSAEPIAAAWIARLLAMHQVYLARSNRISKLPTFNFSAESDCENRDRLALARDWAIFHLVAEFLFDYARGEVECPPLILTENRLGIPFFDLPRMVGQYPGLQDELTRAWEWLNGASAKKLSEL